MSRYQGLQKYSLMLHHGDLLLGCMCCEHEANLQSRSAIAAGAAAAAAGVCNGLAYKG